MRIGLVLAVVLAACGPSPAPSGATEFQVVTGDVVILSPQLGRGTFRINVVDANGTEGAIAAYAWRPPDVVVGKFRNEFWILTADWPEPKAGSHPRLKFRAVNSADMELAGGANPFDHANHAAFREWARLRLGGNEDAIRKDLGHAVMVFKDT